MMGSTSNGKLGVGDLAMSTEFHKPLCVELLHIFGVKVKTLSCGAEHTLCLTSNGVYSWGSNKYGQLGIGEGVPFSSKPIAVSQFILEKPVHVCNIRSFSLQSVRFELTNFSILLSKKMKHRISYYESSNCSLWHKLYSTQHLML